MQTEPRSIVHIDLDTFFVSVERLKNPALFGQPVVIGGDVKRGVVAACSYEARKFGVRSAMPMAKALQLCPHAVWVKGSMGDYGIYSRRVTEIIANEVPLFQKSSIDEFYIDLTGTERFIGAYKLASELRQKIIRETSLPISFGFSTSKTVSKIATGLAKPNGQLKVDPGKEKEFLAPLPIAKIPMAGPKIVSKLNQMGLILIKDLQNSNPKLMEELFGKQGLVLWNKAQGICHSQVEAEHERKSISSEHTFREDAKGAEFLKHFAIKQTAEIAAKLRRENKTCGMVAIKLRTPDFSTKTFQTSIPPANEDHILIPHVVKLLGLHYKNQPLRLIGVKLGNLSESAVQADLFSEKEKSQALYKALDSINSKFGKSTLLRASDPELKKKD